MNSPSELGEVLARGRTAVIHRWSEGRVVKVFHAHVSVQSVDAEREYTGIAHRLGLPVPAVGEQVSVQGRAGIVFEEVRGPSMFAAVARDPRSVEPLARELAALHWEVHRHAAPAPLPAQSDRLAAKIARAAGLSPAARRGVLAALARMPAGESLCHGDLHPDNVILSDRGPVIVDWADASRGHPVADLARTSLLLLGYSARSATPPAVRAVIASFHRAYLADYVERLPHPAACLAEHRRWLPIAAAARLSEGIAEEEDWLRQTVEEGLKAMEAGN